MIMDEPNSSLTETETRRLFDVIHSLQAKGVTIIYVSHRIEEVLKIADRITALRDGQYVGTIDQAGATIDKVINMMVGRELERVLRPADHQVGEVLLEVKGLTRTGVIEDVSFSLRKGEILGLAGLVGAGRSETARIIFGADKHDRGEILLENTAVEFNSPREAIDHGLGMVPLWSTVRISVSGPGGRLRPVSSRHRVSFRPSAFPRCTSELRGRKRAEES